MAINEIEFRAQVALMRELGVIQAFGIVLGPEPRTPSKLESLEKRALEEDTPSARRAARVEAAREAYRDKLGNWDLSDAAVDKFIDPSVFDE